MKKMLLFTIILGATVAFTSCSKKDYTCTCTTTIGGTSSTTTYEYEGVKEDDAQASCDVLGSGSSTTCSL
jgi:uncharacterized lipoprotein YehR (DUF1307 family)